MPAYLAARRRRLPIVVHEQNALPASPTRPARRIARRVAVASPTPRSPGRSTSACPSAG
ncbi:MAG: glycosyltransferase [Nocardioides sp.]